MALFNDDQSRVEAGIIKALTAQPLPVRRALPRRVDILIDLTVADHESGTAIAAEIVGTANKEAELASAVSRILRRQ